MVRRRHSCRRLVHIQKTSIHIHELLIISTMTFVSENDLLTFLEDDNTTYDLFSSFGFDFDTDEQLNESNRDESNKDYQDVESCNPFDRLLQLEQMNPFFYYPEEMFGKKREAPFDELLKQEPPMKKVKYNNYPTL